jgi:hypothetical protein
VLVVPRIYAPFICESADGLIGGVLLFIPCRINKNNPIEDTQYPFRVPDCNSLICYELPQHYTGDIPWTPLYVVSNREAHSRNLSPITRKDEKSMSLAA